ncbi:MAG: hypothetical protein CVU39_12990 [Chloroflexi bacterium HGW-Chloroflexi-10]|nr:MAG: hypothetical protein CVU39_12990 [Chloroflexi bacterium HGW-Chloroflexi-10]
MKQSKTIFFLSLLIVLLTAVYAGIGLFSQDGKGPFNFTTLHGETVEIYGRGIYRNDTAFKAPIFRGTDAVTFFLAVPALLVACYFERRSHGTLRSRLFLTSLLAYFLYNSASLALGTAFNSLLLIYIAVASLSLYAFILAFRSINLTALAAQTSTKLPHRWIAVFLFLAGLSLVIWIMDIAIALIQKTVPANLGHYHTESTYILDLGVILPSAYLAGVLTWTRKPLGTLLAVILIMLNLSVGLAVVGQTVMMILDGIVLKPSEIAAYVAPFVTLGLLAIGLVIAIFHHIANPEKP